MLLDKEQKQNCSQPEKKMMCCCAPSASNAIKKTFIFWWCFYVLIFFIRKKNCTIDRLLCMSVHNMWMNLTIQLYKTKKKKIQPESNKKSEKFFFIQICVSIHIYVELTRIYLNIVWYQTKKKTKIEIH